MATQPDPSALPPLLASVCDPLGALQRLAVDIYGTYDRDKALLWLCEELGELIQAIRQNRSPAEIGAEYSDVLTWVICLSNILGLSLSDAAQGALLKEVTRQMRTYGELKYWQRE